MSKKNIFFLCLLLIISFFRINYGIAYFCNPYSLETDKDIYYFDEVIHINASWDLDYDPLEEISFTKVIILNGAEMIWNTSKNSDLGFFSKNWDFELNRWNYTLIGTSVILKICLFWYYEYILTGMSFTNTLLSKDITIRSRDQNIYNQNQNNNDIDTLYIFLIVPILCAVISLCILIVYRRQRVKVVRIQDLTIKY